MGLDAHEALRKAAQFYKTVAAQGDFVRIEAGPPLKEGARGPRVVQLRARFAAAGDLPGSLPSLPAAPTARQTGRGAVLEVFDEEEKEKTQPIPSIPENTAAAQGELFDHALHRAVRAFQLRHGLNPDGVVQGATLKALNVSAEARFAVIEQNLARLSALPKNPGARYVHVNIAGAELEAVDNGRVVMRRRVVVGQPSRPTPEMSSAITFITLNPYWNIPPSIAQKDIIPKARQERNYLRDRNIRVFSSWGEASRELDSASVDWSAPEAKSYRLRQDPSPNNSLGTLRINFANSHSVYLHDTPAQSLFDRYGRAYSSGCVRVERVRDVAEWLLSDKPAWDRRAIDRGIASQAHTIITLSKPVPIYVTYLTAWVDGTGRVQFRDDIYRHDRSRANAGA
jgi:murein L,D-transpeptidase YcbB/YkuD